MLSFLPTPLLLILHSFYLLANLFILAPLLLFMAIFKLIPFPRLKKNIHRVLVGIANTWSHINNFGFDLFTNIHWDIQGLQDLSIEGRYLVISNHQTWFDILVLQKVFVEKAPFLRFLMKRQLIWLPFVGLCCWALELPFMNRYGSKYLEKHPEKKGKDLETIQKFCESFKGQPLSILSFVEGTRFTKAKHQKQQSPYQHLLKPRAGGLAYVLKVMGSEQEHHIQHLLNVTIVYPGKNRPRMIDVLQNKVPTVVVRVEKTSIPAVAYGNYFDNPKDAEAFQQWINALWKEKDQTITAFLKPQIATSASPCVATN